jgi:hypothetical protein
MVIKVGLAKGVILSKKGNNNTGFIIFSLINSPEIK